MDRIWRFILTAPPSSIETDATTFAIEVYLDHNIIHRSPRSAVEATHMALVDHCVDQLKSAASKLKPPLSRESTSGVGETTVAEAVDGEIDADELKFSRSLFFLRQFLQALRARPQYSPPQNSPPNLPTRPLKGELIDIRYQAFDGGSRSRVRSLQIGDLSTASELVDTLIKVTGFPKLMTIYSGHRVDLVEKRDQTLRDLKLGSGLLIVRRDPSCRGTPGRRFQPLTSVDTEVLKHFDDLYDLLNLDDHLAREVRISIAGLVPGDLMLIFMADI
jgi:ubiquitin carboxyl-terminal hydrolase 34